MSQERRLYTRFTLELAAEITLGDQQFTATTKDISEGGCCIVCAYPLPEDATVACSLFVVVDGIEEAGMPSLQLAAQVQWAADNEGSPESRHMAGLRFTNISDAQRGWLVGVLQKAEASRS